MHPSYLGCVFVLDVSFILVTEDDGCPILRIADIEVSECGTHKHLGQWLCCPYPGEVALTSYILPTIPQTDQATDMEAVNNIDRTDLDVQGVISGLAFTTDCPITVSVLGHVNSDVQVWVI